MQHADVRAVVAAWQPDTHDRAADDIAHDLAVRADVLAFLDANADGLYREFRTGHITASALVLDAATRRAALVLHPLIKRWLQPGGHLEREDADLIAATRREISEEIGVAVDIDPRPLRLDVHPVTCRLPGGGVGPSVHYDVTLLAVTEPHAHLPARPDPTAWFSLETSLGPDATLERLRHAALRRISQSNFSTA